jgi:hypothetical protein
MDAINLCGAVEKSLSQLAPLNIHSYCIMRCECVCLWAKMGAKRH